jgi:hypothetical protein
MKERKNILWQKVDYLFEVQCESALDL